MVGEAINLTCLVKPATGTSVGWFLDEVEIGEARKGVMDGDIAVIFLFLSPLRKGDSGEYECRATRNLVTVSESLTLEVIEICDLDVDPGTCSSEKRAFFFNREIGVCERFTYSGCGGNQNRFSTIRECRDTCNLCLLPPETGLCEAFVPSFFFNSTSKKCEGFIYGGCQGNANRFSTIMDCEGMCGGGDCPPTCSKLFCDHNRGAICSNPGPQQLPGCTGPCQLTYCSACYYSEETLPTPDVVLPQRCQGITDYTEDERCLLRWANEVRRAHRREHGSPLVKDPELFKCYSPDCSHRG